jgi:hypothetical protein
VRINILLPALALAAALLSSCASIPSLNEPALYSTCASVEKGAEGERAAEIFVLQRAGGLANDDKYEYLVTRESDAPGAPRFILSMRYTGNAPESIERIAVTVDGRYLGVGPSAVTRGYSGRFRTELVRSELGADAVAAIVAAKGMAVQYYGKYPTFPTEIPGPGLEALKAFLKL